MAKRIQPSREELSSLSEFQKNVVKSMRGKSARQKREAFEYAKKAQPAGLEDIILMKQCGLI